MFADEKSQPLVSCIMPTYNRRKFVPLAIRYFLRQDYPNKELVIIDDGADAVIDLVPKDERIRYIRMQDKTTLGAKLNLACDTARGTIIVHWDDDDWYASRRIRYQIEALRLEKIALSGINNLLYLDLCTNRAHQYVYPDDQRTWLSGSILCYRKDLWISNPFAEVDVGMDGLFVWAVPPEKIVVLKDPSFAVFTIHGDNVSPKNVHGQWWHPYPIEGIRTIMGSDWILYHNENSQTESGVRRKVATGCDHERHGSEKPVRNIFACLIHENLECVVDLVRNLRYHDPCSTILLYNGGKDSKLLRDHFPFDRYGSVVFPSPRPMSWGRLHDFALDCMRFAFDHFAFDTLTIVDSDQLAIRSNLSHYLAGYLLRKSEVGMLGTSAGPQPRNTNIAPVVQAFKEIDLWRPFLQRFKQGEKKFVHWTFWPSTVFTVDAAQALVELFEKNVQLQDIMCKTKIWATEEVILPTLVSLLGYKIEVNPCSYEYVDYRKVYSKRDIHAALEKPDAYWVHPIGRAYDNPLRTYIRERCNHYEKSLYLGEGTPSSKLNGVPPVLLTFPILNAMRQIEGWLAEEEADLLIAACCKTLTGVHQNNSIVEIGSYCGRATIVLGSVAKEISPGTKVYAIDPHNGAVGALDKGIISLRPSLEHFMENVSQAGLADIVVTIVEHSFNVKWEKPINLLLIDGLHDYVNVARDFFHYEPWIVDNGYVVFHDYADYYPGVKTFVNELLTSGLFERVASVRSLVVLQKKVDS